MRNSGVQFDNVTMHLYGIHNFFSSKKKKSFMQQHFSTTKPFLALTTRHLRMHKTVWIQGDKHTDNWQTWLGNLAFCFCPLEMCCLNTWKKKLERKWILLHWNGGVPFQWINRTRFACPNAANNYIIFLIK